MRKFLSPDKRKPSANRKNSPGHNSKTPLFSADNKSYNDPEPLFSPECSDLYQSLLILILFAVIVFLYPQAPSRSLSLLIRDLFLSPPGRSTSPRFLAYNPRTRRTEGTSDNSRALQGRAFSNPDHVHQLSRPHSGLSQLQGEHASSGSRILRPSRPRPESQNPRHRLLRLARRSGDPDGLQAGRPLRRAKRRRARSFGSAATRAPIRRS